ncbi:MAG: thrombospondin type 3 repeat-containing protein [Candidatus Binatia bacterium]
MILLPRLAATAACLLFATQTVFAAPPANDNFASAITIGATPYTDSKSTNEATTEASEPTALCGGSGRSIWYKYTAPSTGTVIADTFGSNFDTVLAAFTGATLATLSTVHCNDDSASLQSRMPFAVQAGTTYYIRVNGYTGDSGSVTFHLSSVVAPAFPQCPAIGSNSGCQHLVTAQNDATFTVDTDTNQGPYPNGVYNGRLVGVQNASGAPLCALNLNASSAFNFTIYGLCSSSVTPQPAMCPFGPTEYEGPGVSFDPVSTNFGTVLFDPCIPDGGSSYFGIAGSTATLYACAEDESCGPDSDGDGVINGVDNCTSQPNPGQENRDGDGDGDVCDSIDNTLTVRGTIKMTSKGRQAVLKGFFYEPEPSYDSPDFTGGVRVIFADAASSYFERLFAPSECVSDGKKIVCETLDEQIRLTVKIAALAKDRPKVPWKLKWRDTDMMLPPFYAGPLFLRLEEQGTYIERQGQSSTECKTSPTKVTCK